MRTYLFAALVLLPTLAVAADSSVPALMGEAQRAYAAGDYNTAKDLFGQVLQVDPHNTMAINFLRSIRLSQGVHPPVANDPLKAVIIPKIEFKDATFSSALDFMKAAAAKQSVSVSFVSQLPKPQMDHTVTLSLSQIPFLDGLHYLCALNDADYKVERYAIVIIPAAAASPAPSAAATQ
jgi:hypothetical protein